jgi:hypothetical protein
LVVCQSVVPLIITLPSGQTRIGAASVVLGLKTQFPAHIAGDDAAGNHTLAERFVTLFPAAQPDADGSARRRFTGAIDPA